MDKLKHIALAREGKPSLENYKKFNFFYVHEVAHPGQFHVTNDQGLKVMLGQSY